MASESRDRKYEELENYFNSSVSELKTEIFQTKSELTNLTGELQYVEDSQTEMRGDLTGNELYLKNIHF